MDETTEEIKHLQRCISNLIQIGSLSAIWSIRRPASIVDTVLDALVAMMDLDCASVRLIESIGDAPTEAVAGPHPIDTGDVSTVTVSLGLPGELGELVAASSRLDFPTVLDRLTLRVAANEAAIGLQEALRLDAHLRREAENATLSERARVAGELHDTLLQGFTGVTLQLQGVLQRWKAEGRDDSAANELSRVLSLADRTLHEGRQAVWDLRASEAAGDDLGGALEGAVRRVIGPSSTNLRFEVTGVQRPVPPAVEMAVVRIAREAAFNAVKHAQSLTIEIHLCYEPSSVRLTVRDDGRGLPSGVGDPTVQDGRWGVIGMRERAQRIGGTLEITSTPDQGTTLSLRVPSLSAWSGGGSNP